MGTTVCAVCSSEKVKKVRRIFSATYNQTPVALPNTAMYECATCGERFFTPDQARQVSLAVRRRARSEAGLLAPTEIVAIRKKLGLSQRELEKIFGLGSKVVTRWETGRVLQGKTADVALRLLALDPANLRRLRVHRGQARRSGAESVSV